MENNRNFIMEAIICFGNILGSIQEGKHSQCCYQQSCIYLCIAGQLLIPRVVVLGIMISGALLQSSDENVILLQYRITYQNRSLWLLKYPPLGDSAASPHERIFVW